MLAFGTEAVVSLEIGIPNLWASGNSKEKNSKNLRANLDLIKEVRSNAKLGSTLN